MDSKTGHATITYKMILENARLDWLEMTQDFYNRAVELYFHAIIDNMELLALSNRNLFSQLEIIITSSNPKIVGIPSYFRRAAINSAIGLARSYNTLMENWAQKKDQFEKEGKIFEKKPPSPTQAFNFSPVFYKGMHKGFSENQVMLKLWNGSSWIWVKHKFHGRPIPDNAEHLSPTVVIAHKRAMLHIPIVQAVYDIRTVKQRVKDKEKFCSVAFSGSDTLAVCALHNSDGRVIDSYFVRGGKECAHRRKCLLGKIKRNNIIKQSMGGNDRLREKIKNINDYYAHKVSRRVIDYCIKNGVKIIVIAKQVDRSGYKQYLNVSDSDFLGHRIVDYLQYKAWLAGIVVTSVRRQYSSNKCYICRSYIKKFNKDYIPRPNFYGGRNFICPNGHQGNSFLNASKNLGQYFVKKFPPDRIFA